jgi:long-chain acyl-CoA synthetase
LSWFPDPDVHPSLLYEQASATPTRRPGESAVIRNRYEPHGFPLVDQLDGQKTVYESFWNAVDEFKTKDYIGFRNGKGFQFLSFSSVAERATHFGSGLLSLGLSQSNLDPVPATQLVGLFLKNSINWAIADIAALSFGLVSVPIHESFDVPSLQYLLNHTELRVLLTDLKYLDQILALCEKCVHLKTIIISDCENIDYKIQQSAKNVGVKLLSFTEIEQFDSFM